MTNHPPRSRAQAAARHQSSERGHDDGTETLDAGFVNRGAPVVTLVEAMEREVDRS